MAYGGSVAKGVERMIGSDICLCCGGVCAGLNDLALFAAFVLQACFEIPW